MQPFLLPDCSLQVHIALLSFEASLNMPSASNWNVQPLWKKGEETSNQHVQPVTPQKKTGNKLSSTMHVLPVQRNRNRWVNVYL